jgi:hypothetical protein
MSETRLEYVPALGRRTRLGAWEDQKISTYRKIIEAIGERRWDDAAELGNFFVDEAKVCFAIYRQWIPDLSSFLAENGVPRGEIAEAVARVNQDLPEAARVRAFGLFDKELDAAGSVCDGWPAAWEGFFKKSLLSYLS